jgi:amino acid transporter
MMFNFDTLVTTQILFALVGLCLQFSAFIRLKYTSPDSPRPYAVPGGVWGAWALSLPFFCLAALIAFSNVTGGLQNWVSFAVVLVITIVAFFVGDFWWVKGGQYDPELVKSVLQGKETDANLPETSVESLTLLGRE